MPSLERPTTRLRSLDGVRGVAALVVLLSHCYLLAKPHLETGVGSPTWWLENTPLRVVISGNEAVLIFFLLSGLVVSLPALREDFDWLAYYPRRLIRLYLPVIGSVLVAAALIAAISRSELSDGTWASDDSAKTLDPLQLVLEASLISPEPSANNPLWSLTWEVAFSLLLPLFIWIAVATRRYWVLAIVLCLALRVVGNTFDITALIYLPVFLIGTIAAANLAKARSAGLAISGSRRGALWWSLIIGTSMIMLVAAFVLAGLELGSASVSAARQLTVLGAIGLVFAAIGSPSSVSLLSAHATQWLGKISFSLYLLHVPILVAVVALLGERNWVAAILVSLPASLLAAALYERLVEMPSHRLARSVGNSIERRRNVQAAPQ